MRILLIFFLGLLLIQCNTDEDLVEALAMENTVTDLQRESDDNSKTPINWPWRGININSKDTLGVNENTIKEIKVLGVNSLRIIISARAFSIKNNLSIEEGVVQNLKWCEKVIKWCAKENIVVIIESLDWPLDPSNDVFRTSLEFWESEDELSAAISYINEMVVRFDKYENVVAYDFFSEPVVVSLDGTSARPENWFSFFNKILSTIRTHSSKYVVFTPGAWGLAGGYNDFTKPWDDDKIIYGFHYYSPHSYTHQKIEDSAQNFISYPGLINNKYWDANTARETISPAVNWAKKHNKLLYVGEFSVVRWAEGKEQYLEDVLNVFEENEMGYTYWVLNEWVGWNMDYEPIEKNNTNLIKTFDKTKTREILENFWSKNN